LLLKQSGQFGDSIAQRFLDLSQFINFSLVDISARGKTVLRPSNLVDLKKVMVSMSIQLLEPLLRDDLTPSERLAQQFQFAKTVWCFCLLVNECEMLTCEIASPRNSRKLENTIIGPMILNCN
jgi:hypothetical protein